MALTESELKNVNSFIEHVRKLVGRWADEKGVKVEYNRRHRHLIRFLLRTPDDIPLVITYDLNQTSSEYIANLVQGVREKVGDYRRQRHENKIIIQQAMKASNDSGGA